MSIAFFLQRALRCRSWVRGTVALTAVAMLLVVVVDPTAATSATTGLVFSSNTDVHTVAPGTKAPPGAMALSSGQYSVKAEMITRGGTSFAATAVYANGNPPASDASTAVEGVVEHR